jgi:hypothetical protein
MTSLVKNLGEGKYSIHPKFLGLTMNISNYRDNEMDHLGDNKHTLYIANEDYWSLIVGDVRKERYKNEKGELRVYKRVGKGIYVHNGKSILAPTFLNALVKHNNMKPTASIGEHITDLRRQQKNNHTGNHHRNNFVSVPPPASSR